MPDETYPKRIPRERAVAALDLANALLDFDLDLEGDEDGDVEIGAHTWSRWLELARRASAVEEDADDAS